MAKEIKEIRKDSFLSERYKLKRVAAYARVSTDKIEQINNLETQKNTLKNILNLKLSGFLPDYTMTRAFQNFLLKIDMGLIP